MIQTDGHAGKPDQSTLTMCVVQLESGFLVRFLKKYLKCTKQRMRKSIIFYTNV
jgi:hypothetical protein